MASTELRLSFAALSVLFLAPLAIATDDPLFHFCSNSGNFTANGSYQTNLYKLLGDLYFKTPPTGFGLSSSGQYRDQAYGLSLCRGDASNADCKTCVETAGREIRKHCPYNEGAIIWYDNCLLKYEDNNFFGKIDDANRFYMWNLENVSSPQEFNLKTRELLSGLANKAYESIKLYATGESEIGDDEKDGRKLYGLVQCTRDLTRVDCKKCLDGIINELPSCCDGKVGGRVVGGSCNFRYEVYPFVNA